MRKSLLALPAIAALLTLGTGAAAQASIHPHPADVVGALSDTNGTAGWYTNQFGQQFTQVDGTFTLNLENIANVGGVGIQLCNATTGYSAQVGAIPDGSGWAIVFSKGYLHGDPTGDGDSCNGGGFLDEHITGFGVTQLGTVGPTATVQAQIKEVNHGLLFTVADGPIVNFSYFLHSYPGHFNEAAAGTSEDLTTVSAPAINDLTDFSNVSAHLNGETHGFATWNAVSVSSSFDGIAPWLLTPTQISPAAVVRTWHPGHRVHHHWVRGHYTYSGIGPSSFSILAGTPIGA